MRCFKLTTGIGKVYPIQREIFEQATKKKSPYYMMNDKNEKVQYAVCPACDNPIQILGLYKKLKNTDHPYGKHYPKDIYKLANYQQQAYEYCPFAEKNHTPPDKDARKEKMTEYEKNIYNIVRTQFDRVIYVLSNEIDIQISFARAKRMLTTYVNGEGWMYPWATLYNIPWVFGYLTWAGNLYGQSVKRDSDLYQRLLACNGVKFEPDAYRADYEKMLSEQGVFLDLSYCLMIHERKTDDDNLTETMQFVVTQNPVKDNEREIYRKKLVIDEKYFMNLISQTDGRYRNERLLRLAEEIMPDL